MDSLAPAVRLVLDAGDHRVKGSRSQRDGTEQTNVRGRGVRQLKKRNSSRCFTKLQIVQIQQSY